MKNILLLYDVPNWAWDRNASALIKYLPEYNITKAKMRGHSTLNMGNYDHIHSMGWLPATFCAEKVTAGVCSHNFQFHDEKAEKFFPKFKYLTVNSNILYNIVTQYTNNVIYAPNGVHQDLFTPRIKKPENDFIVGWVGQETHGGLNLENHDRIDIKGFRLVLRPLMEKFKKHPHIKFKVLSNKYFDAKPYEEMPDFYNDVDVQICTSYREGTPNPMFEAASCGKPLITTRVGAISEMIVDCYNGYLIDEYNNYNDIERVIDQFYDKILFLYNNREYGLNMGERNRAIIENEWTWEKKAQNFKNLFEMMDKYTNI